MDKFDLDLDILAPQSKKVKINNKIIDVYPPKFKVLVEMLKVINELSKLKREDAEGNLKALSKMKECLLPVIPSLKERDIDLGFEQLVTLLGFVIEISTPQNTSELKRQGYEVKEMAQKKIEPIS